MEAALIIYAIYVLATLVWCASRIMSLRYVPISADTLNQWSASRENLIVIRLHSKSMRRVDRETVPGMLDVSPLELPGLLRWIPPQSSLVFCGQPQIVRFDANIEELLFRAKINPVYFLVRPASVPLTKLRIPNDNSVPRLR
jgi:hypothetical protein